MDKVKIILKITELQKQREVLQKRLITKIRVINGIVKKMEFIDQCLIYQHRICESENKTNG